MVVKPSLQARVYACLDHAPERRAIAFGDPQGRFSWLSREEFYRRGVGAALQLIDHGLARGDVCVIVLPSRAQTASMLFGTLLVGAVPVLVAPPSLQRFNSDLLRILNHTVRKTGARVVVHDESLETVRSAAGRARQRTRFLLAGDEIPVACASGEIGRVLPAETDVAAMQLTSGTTGLPRICVWEHHGVLAALDGMANAMKLSDSDVCFNWTPLYHDMGLVNNFFLCLTRGLPMVLQNPNDFVRNPASWLRGLADTGATLTWSPNFGFAMAAERITDEELDGVRLDRVHSFWNAAERIHLESMLAFGERFAPYGVSLDALKTNFGCAENVGGATFSDPDGRFVVEHVDRTVFQEKRIADAVPADTEGHRSVPVVGVGRPHTSMKIKILSRAGKPLPDGHIGEVALDTPSRMVGYLKDAAATRRALYGDLLRTGDLGYLRGRELFWVGRVKERVNLRGKKLDPSDFERALLGVEGLRKGCFAAFGVPDPALGTERLVILSEVREPVSRSTRQIADEIRQGVYLQVDVTVSDVVLVRPGTLAKTSSGKRRHNHFGRLYEEGGLRAFIVEDDAQQSAGPVGNHGGNNRE